MFKYLLFAVVLLYNNVTTANDYFKALELFNKKKLKNLYYISKM